MKKVKKINKNSIPFLLLAVIHLGMVIYLGFRRRDKSTWLLLLTNIGLAYLFDYIVLNLFKAYTYKPSIIKKRYLDNIFGAILSQGIFVPITSTLLTVLNKNWRWKVGFTIYFHLIEKLFMKIKIYKVHWWKPIYTIMLMPLYFFISDILYKALRDKQPWSLKVSHYLSIEVVGINVMYISALIRRIRFGRGKHHSWREHFIIAPLYSFLQSYIALTTSYKQGLVQRMKCLAIFVVIDQSLVYLGVLKMNFKQSLRSLPIHILMIFVSRFFYRLIYERK
ncbi:hypothetical protein [Aquibacillus saliphilus]|uniref:hypothetical protein n=1 Tax=Aquibacillus saliphilus TaxID=1909422 RepID=UPI001CF02C71|nr:hypothetical protein [Aquibacillus saliphilus]